MRVASTVIWGVRSRGQQEQAAVAVRVAHDMLMKCVLGFARLRFTIQDAMKQSVLGQLGTTGKRSTSRDYLT